MRANNDKRKQSDAAKIDEVCASEYNANKPVGDLVRVPPLSKFRGPPY